MTREEAIKIINCYDIGFYDLSGEKIPADKLADACDMAIEALKQVTGKLNNPEDSLPTADSEACKEQKSKLDLISRAEAIKSLNGKVVVMGEVNKDEVVSYIKTIMRRIKNLPSADRPRGEWIE